MREKKRLTRILWRIYLGGNGRWTGQ